MLPKKEVSQAPKIKKDLFSKPLKDLPEEIIPIVEEKVVEEIKATETKAVSPIPNDKLPRKDFKNKKPLPNKVVATDATPTAEKQTIEATATETAQNDKNLPRNPNYKANQKKKKKKKKF